jgi:hypothetical protein
VAGSCFFFPLFFWWVGLVAVASVVAAPVCVSVAIQAVAFLKIPPLWGGSLAILQSLHLIGTFFAFLWKYFP